MLVTNWTKINHWLWLNKLTWNLFKANYIQINKIPKCAKDVDFEVGFDQGHQQEVL